MTEDYFWGITLDKNKLKDVWDPDFKDPSETAQTYRGEHTLLVKQAVLAAEAKDEIHVVEVETAGYKSDAKYPITVLKPGTNQQALLDLLFPDPPVTFKLTKGSGPVYLLGNHSVGTGETIAEEDEDEMEDEFDDEEDIEEPEKNSVQDKKRKLPLNSNSKVKLKKSKESDD